MIGVGGYYLYNRMTRARCSGYDCCSGCSNACFQGGRSNCEMSMDRQMYRDDLMTEGGFYPADEKPWPLKIRVYSVAGAGYPSTPGGCVFPPVGCTDANVETCSNGTSTAEPQELFVTLTVLEHLDSSGRAHIDGARASAGF